MQQGYKWKGSRKKNRNGCVKRLKKENENIETKTKRLDDSGRTGVSSLSGKRDNT